MRDVRLGEHLTSKCIGPKFTAFNDANGLIISDNEMHEIVQECRRREWWEVLLKCIMGSGVIIGLGG